MKYSLDNYILEIENFFTKEECKEYIDMFNFVHECGFTGDRYYAPKHVTSDTSLSMYELKDLTYKMNPLSYVSNTFVQKFWEHAYKPYAKEFSVLGNAQQHNITTFKIQKTAIGEGYHSWHFETDTHLNSDRLITFIVYLNDVSIGGETEFLYYPKRCNAVEGKLVMFPGSFTHTHRGNPPISNEKYILTGWLFYTPS